MSSNIYLLLNNRLFRVILWRRIIWLIWHIWTELLWGEILRRQSTNTSQVWIYSYRDLWIHHGTLLKSINLRSYCRNGRLYVTSTFKWIYSSSYNLILGLLCLGRWLLTFRRCYWLMSLIILLLDGRVLIAFQHLFWIFSFSLFFYHNFLLLLFFSFFRRRCWIIILPSLSLNLT